MEALLPRKQRTGQRLYECLQQEGYRGGYLALQRYVTAWKKQHTYTVTASNQAVATNSALYVDCTAIKIKTGKKGALKRFFYFNANYRLISDKKKAVITQPSQPSKTLPNNLLYL